MSRYAALALLALAACGSEHAGSLPPLSSAPVTASAPSPSATPADDVEAAVRAYFATLAAAGRTGNTTALKRLVDSGCSCRDQVAYIDREAAAGHRITTTYSVESVRAHDVTAAGGSATVTFSSPASAVVDAHGHTIRSLAALSHVGMEITFRRRGDAWTVVRLVRLGAS